jgi:hypothetical protein
MPKMKQYADRYLTRDLLGPIILILVIQVLLAANYDIFSGKLWGTDSYMWQNRVVQLHESGNWQNHNYTRLNPTDGHTQHWTRPFDAMLYLGAWLGTGLTDFATSLHVWGVIISPLFQIFALFALFRALTPILAPPQFEVLGLLFISQAAISAGFVIGRPDHQSLLYLLLIVTIGIIGRLLIGPCRNRLCLIAGLVSALAIWVSIESMILVSVNLLFLGILWLLVKEDFSRKLFYYTLSLFAGSILALLVDHESARIWEPVFDRLSIVHIVLFGLIFIFWAGMENSKRFKEWTASWQGRLGCATIGAIIVTGAMALLFPDFFAGPLDAVDDLYRRAHLEKISEFQPVFSLAKLQNGDWWPQIQKFCFWLGIIIPVVPAMFLVIKKTRGPERRFWAYIASCLLVFIPLAILQVRWSAYVVILSLPAYAWLVAALLEKIRQDLPSKLAVILKVPVLVLCALWFIFPSEITASSESNENGDAISICSIKNLAPILNDPTGLGDHALNLLAFVDFGPELLYRTGHTLYSMPNHRPQPGFTDSYMIMSAASDIEAKNIVEKRKVDLILICTGGAEKNFYINAANTDTLYTRLTRDNAPPWLDEITLPDEISNAFKLYRVQLASMP